MQLQLEWKSQKLRIDDVLEIHLESRKVSAQHSSSARMSTYEWCSALHFENLKANMCRSSLNVVLLRTRVLHSSYIGACHFWTNRRHGIIVH
ncbi:hypothetical protein A0H81_11011 [Grifola frondosa]|uniref:Uncharacterized protein n=1 Tax=Grifola frondosa TaxID=5627 RepID=A0A1C7LX31_GRIFR|nr:hypothetical protein A0H81_11011 [Grifola frondosa]